MVTITNFVTVQTFLGISSTHFVAKIFTSRNFEQKCKNCTYTFQHDNFKR